MLLFSILYFHWKNPNKAFSFGQPELKIIQTEFTQSESDTGQVSSSQ